MAREFVDRADAGRQILEKFRNKLSELDLLVVVLPAAQEIAFAFASEVTLPMRDLVIARDLTGVVIPRLDNVTGLRVGVIDDGVETGTTAMAIGAMLKAGGADKATLLVPICPQPVTVQLVRVYDEVCAVEQPLVPHALSWHYEK
ncbi:MAG: phosphoribosyltransferase [Actinomycetes bacterium]|jgi:phosphoribosylpyrophosphate synthetase